MRVLHFYKTFFPDTRGGVEQVIHQLARGTQQLGVQTEVLALTPDRIPRTIECEGYLVHRARRDFQFASTGFSASVFFRFAELAKKADLIHYHFPWPFMDLVHFATRIKKPCLVTYHSDIIRQKYLLKAYQPLQWKFLGAMDKIIATSPNYFASSPVLRKYVDKVEVIPIGLDKASYPEPDLERIEFWRNKLGEKFFLFVGMLRYYKGLDLLIEAAQGTNYPIVIVGAGPIEADLKAQVALLGVQNIYFLGPLEDEDKVALLTLCYAVVFPSHLRSEAFGISLLEGAMYGKAMISSEIGTGTTFINIDGETGLVVQPSDPDDLRAAMQTLWEDPERTAQYGKAAAERYWRYFRADQMLKSYVDLYSELVLNKS